MYNTIYNVVLCTGFSIAVLQLKLAVKNLSVQINWWYKVTVKCTILFYNAVLCSGFSIAVLQQMLAVKDLSVQTNWWYKVTVKWTVLCTGLYIPVLQIMLYFTYFI